MIDTSNAIGFMIIYWSINLIYNLEETGLFFFRTPQFRRETAWLGVVILTMAFFFS